jgi:Fe-Mn family superoxide dismutase
MPFQLPDLPYARDALQPVMSAETLDYHHGKHHRAYFTKLNTLLDERGGEEMGLVEVVRAASERGEQGLFNNAAQAWNHSFFWQCLSPEQQKPSGRLADLIESGFGGVEPMLQKLGDEAVNHFSNGWAWLVLDRDQLKITSLHDADTPLVHDGMVPLFTLDVWEHAYYIDYRNERPKFVTSVLSNIVNWEFVGQNLDGQGDRRADQEGAEVPAAETVS